MRKERKNRRTVTRSESPPFVDAVVSLFIVGDTVELLGVVVIGDEEMGGDVEGDWSKEAMTRWKYSAKRILRKIRWI